MISPSFCILGMMSTGTPFKVSPLFSCFSSRCSSGSNGIELTLSESASWCFLLFWQSVVLVPKVIHYNDLLFWYFTLTFLTVSPFKTLKMSSLHRFLLCSFALTVRSKDLLLRRFGISYGFFLLMNFTSLLDVLWGWNSLVKLEVPSLLYEVVYK